MADQLVSVEYFAFDDAVWRSPGWPDIPGGSIVLPTHSHLEVAGLSGFLDDGGTIQPPPLGRNVNVGAAYPGTKSYPLPTTGTIRYCSPTGSDTTGDGLIGTPWKSPQAVINGHKLGANAYLILRGGVYNDGGLPGNSVLDLGINCDTAGITIQPYLDEAVWFDGSVPVTGWTLDTTIKPGTNVWRVPYSQKCDRSVQFNKGSVDGTAAGYIWINPSFPAANVYDQVFLISATGVQTVLTPVLSPTLLAPGKFYVEATHVGNQIWQATRLMIADNPASYAEVRVSNKAALFAATNNNVTLRGFGVRRYSDTNSDAGLIKLNRIGCTADNLTILDSASQGICGSLGTRTGGVVTISNCTVLRAGLNGGHMNRANGTVVSNSEFSYHNTHNWNQAPAAGGFKITWCHDVTITDSVFNFNGADGLWYDDSNYNCVHSGCDAIGNAGHGFEYEISCKGWFIDCLSANNGKGGFLMRCSSACRMWNCTSSGNGEVNFDFNKNDGRVYGDGSFGTDGSITATDPVWGTDQMTWIITTMDLVNCVSANPNPAASAGMFRLRHQPGGTGLPTMQSYITCMGAADTWNSQINGNVYCRPNSASPPTGWVLPNAGGISNGGVFSAFSTYKSATALLSKPLDATGYSADNTAAPINSDWSLKTSIYNAAVGGAVPLTTQIAAIAGQPVNTKHVGIWT